MDFGLFEGGGPKLSSRRFGTLLRKRYVHILIVALNFLEGALDWKNLYLLGRRANNVQRRIHRRLASLVAMSDSPEASDIPAAPGRSGPEFTARLAELEEFAKSEAHFDLRSYACNEAEGGRAAEKIKVGEVRCSEDSLEVQPYSNLNAARLKLVGTGQWRIQDFIDGPLWLPFLEPLILQHDQPVETSLGPNFSRGDPDEYFKLARMWDGLGLLGLSDRPPHQDSFTRIFNAYKNESHDRQIGDRRLANQSEYRLQGPSKYLPGGYMICNVHVQKGHVLIGTATDRKDFYHQCRVTRERANSNVLPFCYKASEFSGFQCLLPDAGATVRRGRDERGDLLGHKPRSVLVGDCFYPTLSRRSFGS